MSDNTQIGLGITLLFGVLVFLAGGQREQPAPTPIPPLPKIVPAKPKPVIPKRP